MKMRLKTRQKMKFDSLWKERNNTSVPPPSSRHRWVVNVSSKTLSESQQSVLAKGLNFAPTPNKCDIPSIITPVEEAIGRCEEMSSELLVFLDPELLVF